MLKQVATLEGLGNVVALWPQIEARTLTASAISITCSVEVY